MNRQIVSVLVFILIASACSLNSYSAEGDWSLVWSDEFDGDALDLNQWEAY